MMRPEGYRQGDGARIMYVLAPHIPAGRLPVTIQSRFIRCTNRIAVLATACVLSSNSNRAANRCMYSEGSIKGGCRLRM